MIRALQLARRLALIKHLHASKSTRILGAYPARSRPRSRQVKGIQASGEGVGDAGGTDRALEARDLGAAIVASRLWQMNAQRLPAADLRPPHPVSRRVAFARPSSFSSPGTSPYNPLRFSLPLPWFGALIPKNSRPYVATSFFTLPARGWRMRIGDARDSTQEQNLGL